ALRRPAPVRRARARRGPRRRRQRGGGALGRRLGCGALQGVRAPSRRRARRRRGCPVTARKRSPLAPPEHVKPDAQGHRFEPIEDVVRRLDKAIEEERREKMAARSKRWADWLNALRSACADMDAVAEDCTLPPGKRKLGRAEARRLYTE